MFCAGSGFARIVLTVFAVSALSVFGAAAQPTAPSLAKDEAATSEEAVSVAPSAADMASSDMDRSAGADPTALAHYQAGRYDAAVAAASEAGGAPNLALAARAMNAAGYFEIRASAARKDALRAAEFAERALEADPDNVEAHLQLAISHSVRAANMSGPRAFLLGLPKRARRSIDAALALDPDNPWALSTSGTWRIEVARRGADRIYKADPDVGFEEIERARALDPDNVVIAFEAAVSYRASDREEWRRTGSDALSVALNGPAQSVFEKGVQRLAQDFQTAVDEGRDAELAFIADQR
ncbi:MAG: hypothetical protein AAGC56_07170 [Pseudomonadota bacterium]